LEFSTFYESIKLYLWPVSPIAIEEWFQKGCRCLLG